MFKKNFGAPLYNLRVDLASDGFTFPAFRGPHENESQDIRDLADICRFADKTLLGPRTITEKGYILPCANRLFPANLQLPFYSCILNLNKNKRALHILQSNLEEKREIFKDTPLVELEYDDGQRQFIRPEGCYLYLPIVREGLGEVVSKLRATA